MPIRAKDARTIRLEIDHREVACPEGVSVLRAAELNGVFIPSLCSHKDLSPFGGCRLCMVEIEGQRGYPLACSTIVQAGMHVQTETTALREMRREILELILSEHPSSCMMCTESQGCRENQYTIRKSGVATGCRWCPNDEECELQGVVERLGVTEIHYPISYRGYAAEHDDPFFDRDYNICILCGRCVRMCQEVRGASVLAFNYRGSRTRIGPAFGRNHVEAGCEFCGACVSVCPTGALADKVSKWDGKPDGEQISTCPFCALGCRIRLQQRRGRLTRAIPDADAAINDGQLCVRGRFCLPEVTHHHERARKPVLKRGAYFREVDWSEALKEVAGHLRGIRPEDFLMLVSPDLTNESLYAARKFVRSGLKSSGLDSTARWLLPGGAALWAKLFSLPISIKDLARADAIIAVGLDSRFYFSVAGVEIRRALREGATLVAIDPRESNLARYTEHWLRPVPGMEGAVLRLLAETLVSGTAPATVRRTGVDPEALGRAVDGLGSAKDLAVVVGPTAFAVDAQGELADALLLLAERQGTTFLPLFHGANTRGALELGVFGELLPGLEMSPGPAPSLADVVEGRATPKVLYLVGETPFLERPPCEYVIAQDIYRPPFEVDAFLPAASFAEAEGTLTNIEGRVQELAKVEDLPDGAITGSTRPDWFIFGALAEQLSIPGLAFQSASETLGEISREVAGFPDRPDRRPRRLPLRAEIVSPISRVATPAANGLRLIVEPGGFRHRGIDMSLVAEGLAELGLETGFRVHPDDLGELGIATGDTFVMRVNGLEIPGVAKADADCPRGTVYAYHPSAGGGRVDRANLAVLSSLKGNPRPAIIALAEQPPAGCAASAAPVHVGHDAAGTESYRVVTRRMIVPNLHELTLEAPQVASAARPGNFVILRPDETGERVPLTVADWDAQAGTVTSIFLQVGASTAKLARLEPGDTIPTYAGPLGRETEIANFGTVLCVAGCYGIGSIYPVARALHDAGNTVITLLEARSAYCLYWQEKFREVSARVLELTRDGSSGYRGHVTRIPEILTLEKIKPDRVLVHGCTFLMMRTAQVTRDLGLKTMVNMNPIMIDGTGMCGVCRLTVGGKMKFACVDGPDFDGHAVDWEEFLKRRKTYNPEEVQPLRRSGCDSHF